MIELGPDTYINANDLVTHAAIFGTTGSGKTGLLLGMAEDVYASNKPVILVDIKGDMCNIALHPWSSREVRCLTPGADHGEPVNVFADLERPERANKAVSQLLAMIGEDPDPFSSVAHGFLMSVLRDLNHPSLLGLVQGCANPVQAELGALNLDVAISAAKRNSLARKLNTLLMSEDFQPWLDGIDLDIDSIINRNEIVVYSVAHLDEEQQVFAIAFLMNKVVRWMKDQSGTDALKLLVAIDECVGLLPPYPAKPVTKAPIMTILKQGRAFGVGLVLATQNPVDIDYKAMTNCWTWFVGRMTAARDRERVVKGLVHSNNLDWTEDQISTRLAGLQAREFVYAQAGDGNIFKTRDVEFELRGPMTPREIREAYDEGYLTYVQPVIDRVGQMLAEQKARLDAEYEVIDIDPVPEVIDEDDKLPDNYTTTEVAVGCIMTFGIVLIALHFLRDYLL